MGAQEFFHLLVETILYHKIGRDESADLRHDRLSRPIDGEQPLIEEPICHRLRDMIDHFFP
jgi:hypothetical protein